MGGILDDLEIEAPGQSLNPGHVADLTTVMDRQNGGDFYSASDRLFDPPFRIRKVQVEIVFPTIHQQRGGIKIADHLGGRCKGHGRNDDRFVRLQADGLQRQMQRRRAGIQSDGIFLSDKIGKFLLELFRPWTRGQPTGVQTIQHGLDLGVGQARAVKGDLHGMKLFDQKLLSGPIEETRLVGWPRVRTARPVKQ